MIRLALSLVLHLAPLDNAVPDLRTFVPDEAERAKVLAHLDAQSRAAFPKDLKLRAQVIENVEQNLADKQMLPAVADAGFRLTAEEIRSQVIDYEIFKLQTFVSAGVFPKRYFGYFDEKWDTAQWEKVLRETTHAAVKLINDSQAQKKSPTRVSDLEIAVTFIAEGGAILLREKQSELQKIHPVYGVGLDDIATGTRLYQDLALQFDKALGTGLSDIVVTLPDGRASLRREMNFKEAILGTALMYIYEKELAAAKMKAAEGKVLAELPLDEQFIAGSLVYNSGLLFSPASRDAIRTFQAGEMIFQLSEKNVKTRGRLPVFAPQAAAALLREGQGYPVQPTSWSALYHVLQRYGGYQALRRFTKVFDAQGMYRAPQGG